MMIDERTGLVLEGGGMRGVFTAGVLDWLMDNGKYFPYTIGVSAGACNGLSYASRQRGRAKICNIDLLDKYRYIGVKYLFTKRSIMDFDLIFNDFPTRIIPYDYDTYFASPGRFVMVTSNCRTGEANYFEEKNDRVRLLNICRASCSLPFVCPKSYVDGVPMLDGGISDAIPIRRAIADGFSRNVVVLTRNKGYRKEVTDKSIPWFMYRRYPALRESLRVKNKHYNETLDYVEQLEEKGQVIIIRPERPLEVDRIERDVLKLTDLYNQGYECAKQVLSSYL
ncbi:MULTISPECIES: patatin-like phospholipase family protein [Butyricimonas]|uniref:patatin-like phospholipase family protein n=1 Tax=Butyricimonas TaxID=574697 RepID=UPI00351D5423